MRNVILFCIALAALPTLTLCQKKQKTDGILRVVAVEQLQEDFSIIRKTIEEACPVLYRYRSKEEVDQHFDQFHSSLTTPLSTGEFYLKLSTALAYLQDNHLRAFIDNEYYDDIVQRNCFLPLQLYLLDGNMYVLKNVSQDSRLAEGATIKNINGINADDLVKRLLALNGTDGDNQEYKYARINGEQIAPISIWTGLPESYTLVVEDASGNQNTVTVPAVNLAVRQQMMDKKYGKEKKKKLWSFEITKESNTAIFRFDTFGDQDGAARFNEIVNDIIEKCNKAGVEHLILDVRNNGGGFDQNAATLFSYLTDKPFQSLKMRYLKTNQISFLEFMFDKNINTTLSKIPMIPVEGGGYTLNMPIDTIFSPQPVTYRGKVYVLISNSTISTTAFFCGLVQRMKRGALIGASNAGGGYKGDSGGNFFILLPNSKLHIRIPFMRAEYLVDEENEAWVTLHPDHRVQKTIQDVLQQRDVEMEYVINLIKGN
jgi:hypothetical protein